MGVGALITLLFHVEKYGVALLPSVDSALPKIALPDFSAAAGDYKTIIMSSLTIALVIVAETLLSTNSYALKYDYKIKNSRELFAYTAGNFVSAISGCGPVSGSVSRTSIAAQFGSKSQVMSIAACGSMLLLLMFGTGFIGYLPVPILTGIVISALMGITEFPLAKKLKKAERFEWFIFYAAFWGVLLFGTIYGVLIGVLLSFVSVIVKAVVPPRSYMGVLPGQKGFYSLKRNRNARPIQGVVIYRFSGTLFFANINSFQEDIENSITDETKAVIVDASAIGSIDTTATERLLIIYSKLKKSGVDFYFVGHVGMVNDQLRKFGAEEMINSGAVRRNITRALKKMGMEYPYQTEETNDRADDEHPWDSSEHLAEFEWAYGDDADTKLGGIAEEIAQDFVNNNEYNENTIVGSEERLSHDHWDIFDENELLDYIELHLADLAVTKDLEVDEIEDKIEDERIALAARLAEADPDALRTVHERRVDTENKFKEEHPDAYERLVNRRIEHVNILKEKNREFADKLDQIKKVLEDRGR
jgi:anti-anti-sigma regulatory factor